jgi:sirohydrochlorin cobaltochelatase
MGVDAVILIGHGGVARDTPRELVRELKALEGARHARGGPMSERERELDHQVRYWPRTPESDPYKIGLEQIAAALRPKLGGTKLVLAYNEFCAPSIDEAIDALVAEGHRRIKLVTTMVTPGGSHAAEEIPEILEGARERHPEATLDYAWPFDLDRVAALLAETAKG